MLGARRHVLCKGDKVCDVDAPLVARRGLDQRKCARVIVLFHGNSESGADERGWAGHRARPVGHAAGAAALGGKAKHMRVGVARDLACLLGYNCLHTLISTEAPRLASRAQWRDLAQLALEAVNARTLKIIDAVLTCATIEASDVCTLVDVDLAAVTRVARFTHARHIKHAIKARAVVLARVGLADANSIAGVDGKLDGAWCANNAEARVCQLKLQPLKPLCDGILGSANSHCR